MIRVQKILFLRHVPLFSGMTPPVLGQLAGIADEVIYSAKDPIIVQDEHGDSMFLIVEGEVRIHHGDEQLAVLKSRDYFGEMSILDGEPRSASASALTNCLLLRIQQADFYRILGQHTNVAMAIIQTLTRRLRQTSAEATQRSPQEEEASNDPNAD